MEKNSIQSFIDSFKSGFGTETDIRDLNGKLVISHDVPKKSSKLIYFEDFLELYIKFSNKDNLLPLALNIKSDGLQNLVKKDLEKFNIHDYFLFDMSLPDQIQYLKCKLKIFTRQSEFEEFPLLYKESDGVWLDSFTRNWFSFDLVNNHIDNGKFVCLVSSELHNRDHNELWELLKKWNLHLSQKIILCTDFPEIAKKYFYHD